MERLWSGSSAAQNQNIDDLTPKADTKLTWMAPTQQLSTKQEAATMNNSRTQDTRQARPPLTPDMERQEEKACRKRNENDGKLGVLRFVYNTDLHKNCISSQSGNSKKMK